MVGKDNLRTGDLNLCFENLMMVAGGGKGGYMKAGVITEWKDIHVELLMQIISFVDDQTVIKVSGVCRGWRYSIFFGLARLSLSWCSKNMNNLVLSLIPKFAKLQTLILLQDKPQLDDNAVETSVENSKFLISKFNGCLAFSDNALLTLSVSVENSKFLIYVDVLEQHLILH